MVTLLRHFCLLVRTIYQVFILLDLLNGYFVESLCLSVTIYQVFILLDGYFVESLCLSVTIYQVFFLLDLLNGYIVYQSHANV